MPLCTARVAFNEPFGDGFVEAVAPGVTVDVPPELVERLVAEGHISRPGSGPMAAVPPPTVGALHARLLRIEAFLFPRAATAAVDRAAAVQSGNVDAARAARIDELEELPDLSDAERLELTQLQDAEAAAKTAAANQPPATFDAARAGRIAELQAMPSRSDTENLELARLQDAAAAAAREPAPAPRKTGSQRSADAKIV